MAALLRRKSFALFFRAKIEAGQRTKATLKNYWRQPQKPKKPQPQKWEFIAEIESGFGIPIPPNS